MHNSIPKLLKNLKGKVDNGSYKKGYREKYLKKLDELSSLYSNIEVPESSMVTFENLLETGYSLLEDDTYLIPKKIEGFLALAYRDYYEFKGTIKSINLKLGVSYVITCALFLLLSSQMFPRIVPLLFIVPMFIGIRGISQRSFTGFTVGTSVIEMALLSSVIALITVFSALRKYDEFIKSLTIEYNKSPEFAQNALIFIVIVSILMLVVSIYNIVLGNKYKKMYS